LDGQVRLGGNLIKRNKDCKMLNVRCEALDTKASSTFDITNEKKLT